MTHYLLFVISLADRVVQLAGITAHPNEAWMMQVGRGTDGSWIHVNFAPEPFARFVLGVEDAC